jgi:16S rRNA (guanine527-N7)-methyltransferase
VENAARGLLAAGLEALGLTGAGAPVNADVVARLVAYHDALMAKNAVLNLTGHKDEAESVTKNVLNALAPWRLVDRDALTADVGSGAGLPGMPLAIALSMPRMVLVESKAKKCKFLEEVASLAPGLRVMCADASAVREEFSQIVLCGFGTLARLLEVTRGCSGRGTRWLAWKGKRETVDVEIVERGAAGGPGAARVAWEIQAFSVPGLDAERHMCIGTRAAT